MTDRFTCRTLVHFYLFLYKKMLCLLAPATLFLLSLFGVVSANLPASYTTERHFGDCANGCRVMFGAAYGDFEANGDTDWYKWPSWAAGYAGVADECTPSSAACVGKGFELHGAFKFLNGGKITFSVGPNLDSSVMGGQKVTVRFKFDREGYPGEDPSFSLRKEVDITTAGDYEIDLTDGSFVASDGTTVPSFESSIVDTTTAGGKKTSFVASDYPEGFNKLHLYLSKRNYDVTLTDIKVFDTTDNTIKPTDAEMIEFLKAKQC